MRICALVGALLWVGCGNAPGTGGSTGGTGSSAAASGSMSAGTSSGTTAPAGTASTGSSTSSAATGTSGSSLGGSSGSGSTGLGGSGSSTSGGATSGGSSGGAPITAAGEQWTWVPFSNAFCGNGTATGIGVNLNPGSTRVLIYLEGGGACYDDLTCYTLQTASYFTSGYGPSDFQSESTDPSSMAESGGFFDRGASANPFQDFSYIYVPYCTGDVHSGDNIVQLSSGPAYFVGYANLTAYLQRVVPTFPAATQVVLAGSSAGGFGAFYNWWRVQQAFGAAPVVAIDDSGTFLPLAIVGGDGADATAWGTAATTPGGCTGCGQDFDALYGFYAQTFPNQRGALLSYEQDSVLPTFYGISETQFTTGLNDEITGSFIPNPSLGYFLTGGSGHVLWFDPQLAVNGVTLQAWIADMVSGGSWTSEEQ